MAAVPEMKDYCVAIVYYAAESQNLADVVGMLEFRDRAGEGYLACCENRHQVATRSRQVTRIEYLYLELFLLDAVFLLYRLKDGIIRKGFFGSAGKRDGVSSLRGNLQSFEVLDVVALELVIVLVVYVENGLRPAQHQDIIYSNEELISSFASFLYAIQRGKKKAQILGRF